MSAKTKEVLSISTLIIFVVAVIGATAYLSKSIFYSLTSGQDSYILKDLVTVDMPVVGEVESDNIIIKPFNDTNVKTSIGFYNLNDERESQEKSLLEYDNTFMPNTGILYSSDKVFDVIAVSEGKVESIKEDAVLGSIITIKHSNNLITKYSSVMDIQVKEGDPVNAGEIIGTSGSNKLVTTEQNNLLFEMIHNGEYVNPESMYDEDLEELN